jgi:hypothetical protein
MVCLDMSNQHASAVMFGVENFLLAQMTKGILLDPVRHFAVLPDPGSCNGETLL